MEGIVPLGAFLGLVLGLGCYLLASRWSRRRRAQRAERERAARLAGASRQVRRAQARHGRKH